MKRNEYNHHSHCRQRDNRFLLLLLSILIPFSLMVIALIGLEIAPFGNHSLLISDANGYYINTLSYAGRMFKGLEGITYSFEKGLGGNMMGHLNGILLTPFAFLLSFADITQYPTVYTWISVLNLSLAGLTMYILLADLCGHRRSNLIFSTCYALMGFQTANAFQAVFFCAAPVLPIMALGLRKLMRGKTPLLYILSIAYGMLTNAYFGFVICVASVLFFFLEFFLRWNENEGKRLHLLTHYLISSILGGLLVAFLWIPSFLSLRGGRLEQNGITDFHFTARQPMLEIFSKLFIGAISLDELINGHPNIYIGLLPVALVILFFLNRHISRGKKATAGILLALYLLSFTVLAFDMLMHGGTMTNWFNFRYSYVFSFLLLVIAAIQWKYIDETPDTDFRLTFIILLVVTAIVFFKSYAYVNEGEVLLDYLVLAGIFFAFRLHRTKPEHNPKKLFEIVTLLLVSISLFLNYRISILNIRQWEHGVVEFQEHVMAVDPLVQAIKASDESFFRMEVNRQRSQTTGNDPMLYGYDGVGHGGSNERNFVREGANKLGVPWFGNRSYYADGVPAATDALMGIKYVIAEEDLTQEKGYEEALKAIDWNIYVNPNAMPIAMLAAGDIDGVETEFTDVFDNLNRVWATLSGRTHDVLIEESDIQFIAHNMDTPEEITAAEARNIIKKKDDTLSKESASESTSESTANTLENDPKGRALKEPPENQSYIEYTWTAQRDSRYYSYNRSGLADTSGSYDPVLRYEGTYKNGETVTGYLPVPGSFVPEYLLNDVAGRFRVASADEEALTLACQAVVSQPVVLEKLKDDHLSGEYTSDKNRQMLFTIPWDEGWTLYVDGLKTDLRKALDVFMTADVPAGTHAIEMRYMPAGLQIGKLISLIALVTTLLYIIAGKRFIGWNKVRMESIR